MRPLIRLRVNNDLSTSYVPYENEIESLLDMPPAHNIYRYFFDEATLRLEIIYREPAKSIAGMKVYELKYFVAQNEQFDLKAFRSFYKACFPEPAKRLSKKDAQLICRSFYQQILYFNQSSTRVA